MALTLDVGGGSGLVTMNRGLRTCSDGGLSWLCGSGHESSFGWVHDFWLIWVAGL